MLDNLQSRPRIRGVLVLSAVVGLVTALGSPASTATDRSPHRCDGNEATIVGTERADDLSGTNGSDVIVGLGGDDHVRGLEGNDVICGGRGNDVLDGGSGDDRIVGGDPRAGDIVQFAGATRGITVDLVAGRSTGQGDDTISGVESARGTKYPDTITVRGKAWGGAGDDTIVSRSNKEIIGGRGNDNIRLTKGGEAYGGHGNDTLDAVGARGANLEGERGNDTIDGNDGVDLISAGPGADLVHARGGNDEINGGQGPDRIHAGPGHDLVEGRQGNDRLDGGAGNDDLDGGYGADRLAGGRGIDSASYTQAGSKRVTVDLAKGVARGRQGNDVIFGTEDILGSYANDVLRGDDGPNRIDNAGGHDSIAARGGDDRVFIADDGSADVATGPGDDWVQVMYLRGLQRTAIAGGLGRDTVKLGYDTPMGKDPKVVVNLGKGFLKARGKARLNNFENIIGDWADSTLIGDDGPNRIVGRTGNDVIRGMAGNDILDGGKDRDRGNGGPGTDTCKRFERATTCER